MSITEPPCVILLYRAILTLQAVPDPDAKFFRITSAWPTYARRYLDAYNPDDETDVAWCPTPADVTTYLGVLAWARELTKRQWHIMGLRARNYSVPMIADVLRIAITDVQQHHAEAVNIIARASWLDRNNHIWCGPLDKPQNPESVSRRHHCA